PELHAHIAQALQRQEEAKASMAEANTFKKGSSPRLPGVLKSSQGGLSRPDPPVASSRERFDKDMELPYWTEYYNKVGRQGDDLSAFISNLQRQGIEVEKSNDAGLSEIKDKSGKVTGYKINHGQYTKKWEMLEEYSHWRVRYGWKKYEIQALEQELKKSYQSPDGVKSRRHNPKRAAEEIIVKRHLLETAESLSEPERIVLEKAINQLYKYGLRYGY
ncbi:MAG TPA: hypothetical protein DCP71_12645, partial [Verrucomicrobiales bacterium]|nr:hypothetical protein [Verrucomicrobiales bacterium]